MRYDIYIGFAEGEGDLFCCLYREQYNSSGSWRVYFREHGDGLNPLNKFTRKVGTLEHPVNIFS